MWRYAVLLVLVPSVAMAGFRVSSYKKESKLGANVYNVGSALDSDPMTAWLTDPEAEPAGQWIEIDLPKGDVDKIAVIAGWGKDDATYGDYGRIKAARVEFFTQMSADDSEGTRTGEASITFEDKNGWQIIDLPDTKIGSEYFGGKLRLTVTEAYEGQDYGFLAVSEVLVKLKEIDTKAKVGDSTPANDAAHPPDHMTDANLKTFWTGAVDDEFRVSADGWGVSSVGFTAGPDTFARPKKVEITASDITRTVELQNVATPQWIELPSAIGYTGSSWGSVTVKILEAYPGKTSQAVGLAEVAIRATNYEGI
jgi:hypothetical protein